MKRQRCFTLAAEAGDTAMLGDRRVDQSALFYEFLLQRHGPADQLLRTIDHFVEPDGLRAHLAPA
jgi:hypothetical protein